MQIRETGLEFAALGSLFGAIEANDIDAGVAVTGIVGINRRFMTSIFHLAAPACVSVIRKNTNKPEANVKPAIDQIA